MSTNVGYATLQVIPSLKNLQRHLKKEADPVLSRWAKDASKTISDTIGSAVGTGVRDSVQSAVGDGAREGVRDGANESATRPIRAGIRRAISGGFRDGFRDGRYESRKLGDGLGRSVRLGVRNGVALGVRQGFGQVKGKLFGWMQGVEDSGLTGVRRSIVGTLNDIRKAAMSAVTGGLNLLAGVVQSLSVLLPIVLTSFSLLAPLVAFVGGLWGSLFTIATGLVGVTGVLGLAVRGLGTAFGELFESGKVSSETLKTLAPNARKFVLAFQGIRKPLSELRRAVQDRVFAGLDKSFKSLAKRWLPALKPLLGDLADRLNGFAKAVMKALGKPDFLKNVKAAFKGFGGFLDRLSESMGPFIDSWGILAKASVPFLLELGERLGGVIDKFNKWMKSAEKSGALKTFMDDAAKALRDIWAIGGLVIGVAGEIIDTFFPSSKKASDSFLGGIRDWLQDIKDWFADPENKERVREWADKISEAVKTLANDVGPAMADLVMKVDGWIAKVEEWGRRLEGWKNKVVAFWEAVKVVANSSSTSIRASINSLTRPIEDTIAAFGRLRAGAERQLGALLGLVRSLPGRILAALGNVRGLLFSAGAAITAGLAAGMRSNIGAVTGAGTALGQAAAHAARRALEVKSPSRVFARIGRFTADGMALGITRGTKRVTRAMRAMVEPPQAATATASGSAPSPALAPLIGQLTLAPTGQSARDQLDEVTWALRRIRRGGLYA